MLKGWLTLKLVMLMISFSAASCSVPNLETAECAAARNSVKRFYSLHFANQMNPTPEYSIMRDAFISERLKNSLVTGEEPTDYFTQTQDFPKAFRIGVCTSGESDAVFQVVLLWRDDVRNEQAEVTVNAIRSGSEWLIDSVKK